MRKMINKANSTWILLFLFTFFSGGVWASEWDEYGQGSGSYGPYGWVEDYNDGFVQSSVISGTYYYGSLNYTTVYTDEQYHAYLNTASCSHLCSARHWETAFTGSNYHIVTNYSIPIYEHTYYDFTPPIYNYGVTGSMQTGSWSSNSGTTTNTSGDPNATSGGGGGGATTTTPCTTPPCTVGYIKINCECVEKPKDPCVQAKKNDVRAINPVILNQNKEIRTKSTTVEFGAEQNLTTFPPSATPTFINVPVRTNSNVSNFTANFTWNPIDGYTIGFSHGHPSQGGPSPADIVGAFDHLSNSDLISGGQVAIDYYKDNFAITVVTKRETFVINVVDWNALGLLHAKYHQDKESKETMKEEFVKKGKEYLHENDSDGEGSYEQTIYAALKLYGNAISISKFDKKTLKYIPLGVSAFNQIYPKPCYN